LLLKENNNAKREGFGYSGRFPMRVHHFLSGLFLLLAVGAAAQPDSPWSHLPNLPARPADEDWVRPQKFHAIEVNHGKLAILLARAPKEAAGQPVEVSMPMPDGSLARFEVVESPIMEPELAAKFPEIKTYRGQGIDDPSATVRFDTSPSGFHAQILSPKGAVYIDPAFRHDRNTHVSYYKRDYKRAADGFQCLVGNGQAPVPAEEAKTSSALQRSGSQLRTYRLACAATGEYVAYHGGTVAAGMAAIVTAINRVDGVYEQELAVRMVLVANNNLIVYTNANSDPYSNDNGSTMLGQNQSTVDSIIGSANYDIGHVFSTGGGGIAYLGCVCKSNKAGGVTGLTAPTGDAFYIDYVAHEMGHQFGGNHTFNSSQSNCGGGNRNAGTAYEVGSGTTIMAYAGICGVDDVQPHSDPYFHCASFDEIISYSTASSGNSCAVITSTTNSAPSVSAGPNYTIPARTPFTLTATGSDPNGDALTYCWEEHDLGASILLTAPDNGSSPLFRSFNPTTNPSRTFPRLSDLLNNTNTLGEKLPTTTRTMAFRVTARDNRMGGGGVNTSDMQVSVVSNAGPFLVTAPNTATIWSGVRTVTWDVAGTTSAPINANNVNIRLSLDGGQTFPIVLASNVANSGSCSVVLPNISTNTARIKVEAAGNIFFDISNVNLSLTNYFPIVAEGAAVLAEGCVPTNNAVDPGETVTVNFGLRNIGNTNAMDITAVLLSGNGVVSPSGSQYYGPLPLNGPAVSRSFSFTATGICGGIVGAVFQIFDGAVLLGTVTNNVILGASFITITSRSNVANIKVPSSGQSGPASPYPAAISVSNVPGTITKVVARLNGISHAGADDLDVLLVSPSGQKVMLLSDAGGPNILNNVDLVFDDAATGVLASNVVFASGTYRPTNFGTSDPFNSPAPAGPYATTLSALNGISPNGTWSLYVMDDSNPDNGNITGGWSLTITTVSNACCNNNTSPTISGIGNQTLNEDTASGAIGFTIGDAETAAASLVVTANSSNTSLVPNANVTLGGSGTNRTLTVTPASNQSGSSTITVTVSDGQASASSSFLLTVNAVNDAPVLAAISSRTVAEGALLTITNSATDIDTPANQLTYSLSNAPAGATINSANGVFTWTPTEIQGPSTNVISIIVSDNDSPNLSDSKSFAVVVTESNTAPVLTVASNQTIHAGMTLVLTNSATDSDLPTNLLSFSFVGTPVAGASLDATNGVFSWTPDVTQIGTNLFTLKVSDNGTPALSDQKSFSVIVLSTPLLSITTDSATEVVVSWLSIPGQSYTLQVKTNLTDGWSTLTNRVAESSLSQITNQLSDTAQFYRLQAP
jgi:subtilisin-like proprotein convertase family protein